MNAFKYVIDSVTDKDGNPKSNIDGKFFIKFVKVGARAVLCRHNDTTFKTSTVEDILIWDNGISIVTKNSIYNLELINK